MSKNNTLLVIGTLLITCLIPACSMPVAKQGRGIANTELEVLLDEFKFHYETELSPARRVEIKILERNILKYLIEATSRDDMYKIKILNEAESYFNKIYPLIINNIRLEKNGEHIFKKINMAPLWTLQEELLFLNHEVEKLPAPKVRIKLLDGISMISGIYKNIDDNYRAKLDGNYQTVVQKLLGADFDLNPSYKEIEKILDSNSSDQEKMLKTISLIESRINKYDLKIRNIG